MQIVVESRRKKQSTIENLWPDAEVIDVTSKGAKPWVRFSPFFPHGGIPLPNSTGTVALSVEGLWQGLKVFEKEGIDPSRWAISNMSGIKRSGKSRGAVLGHQFGVSASTLLGYRDARYKIYLPAYHWVLANRLQSDVEALRDITKSKTLILLDYETNTDIEVLTRPLSHAGLIKLFLTDCWPM